MDKPIPSLAIRGTHASAQLALQLRVEVLDRLEETRTEWVTDTRRWAAHYQAQSNVPITTDAINEFRPPPVGVDSRVMGSVLREPWFKVVGYVNSERRECHGRKICQFVLTERGRKELLDS